MASLERQVVLLPKGAFGSGSRAPLAQIFQRAGYDRVNGDFSRCDQVEQGEFLFRAVKGAEALAVQLELFRGRSIAIVMGTDVLGEAEVLARRQGVRARIDRLLTLGIGRCELRILAPEENPVRSPQNLENRSIFTKYPALLTELLQGIGVSATVRATYGADTRVNEFRSGAEAVAAFEVVGSGETARQSRLQIVREEIPYPSVGTAEFGRIQTDVFLTERQALSARQSDAYQEFGLALESAREENQFVTFRFNIPAALLPAFARFGMKGPTVASVQTSDGSSWRAVEVAVPRERANAVRRELLAAGARDLLQAGIVNAEVSADDSEVLRLLPLESDAQQEAPEPQSEVSEAIDATLATLAETVAERSRTGGPNSYTRSLLERGLDAYGSKVIEEATEVVRAARKETPERIAEETADLLYHLLVLLQGEGVTLASVSRVLRERSR